MADDPNLKYIDSRFVSGQQHEYNYFKSGIQSEFPYKSSDEIADAILACRKELAPSEGRDKLKECVRKRLRGW